MSDPVWPHRRQPTRVPRPWDSPGKNIGVGWHFLLQCMKVKSESEVAQLCPTLSDPVDCSLPGSSVHGTFQTRVLEWGAILFRCFLIFFLFFNWRVSCCVGLCCTTMKISHKNYIYISSFLYLLPTHPWSFFSCCWRQKQYLPITTRGPEGGAPSLPLLWPTVSAGAAGPLPTSLWLSPFPWKLASLWTTATCLCLKALCGHQIPLCLCY